MLLAQLSATYLPPKERLEAAGQLRQSILKNKCHTVNDKQSNKLCKY